MEPNPGPHPGRQRQGRRAEVHGGRDQPDCLLLLFGIYHQQGVHIQRDGDVLGMWYSGISLNSAGKTSHQPSLPLTLDWGQSTNKETLLRESREELGGEIMYPEREKVL